MSSTGNEQGAAPIHAERSETAYARLVRIIGEEIAQGRYRPGDQLPSAAQLCARFGVSGMTVRRAINILIDRGIISGSQGKGVFVRGLDVREAMFRLRERHGDAAPSPSARVRLLQAAVLPAGERVARKLAVARETSVIYLRRLVLQADGPVMYHREYLIYDPRRPTVEAELQITSLEGLFRGEEGQGLRRGDLSLEAVALNREEAELLQVPTGAPALCLEHIFYDFDNLPVAWGWFICHPSRFHLSSRIGPDALEGELLA